MTSTQIMLAQATPPGGVILRVRNQPGSLFGATIEGIDGPNVTLEFSSNGTSGWNAFPPPVALSTETYLRLTRTDTSSAVSTIRLTAPTGITALTDGNGYLSIEGLTPVPTGAQHTALAGRVMTLEAGSGGSGGGGSSAPPALQQGQGLAVAVTGTMTVRQINTLYAQWPSTVSAAPTVVDQIIVGGALFDENNVTYLYLSSEGGATVADLLSEATFTKDSTNTYINIPPTLMGVQSEQLTIEFAAPLSVRTYATQNAAASRMRTRYAGGATGSSVDIALRAAPGLAAPGPISPMSMPVVFTPSATDYDRRHSYTELVVPPGAAPYLRVWDSPGGQWYRLTLTAET
ncbi:hypothetical protein ACMT4L_16695 [Deinococcus sp. A31D244]|uniref:hypothetical protein n=1 Tax=Deinococcus sp. A31D244 TaxID=3397675 RepID=UPI0039E11F95